MHADTTARKGVPDKPSFEPSGHQVQFYKDDAVIVATVARFVADALRHKRGAIVVATKAHLDAVLELVGDVRTALRYNQLVPIDADVLLSRFLVDDVPNEGLFVENVVPVIVKVRAATGHNRVHIYGEMVDVLWRAGNTKAMLALEEMWAKLSSREEIELLSGYCLDGFGRTSTARA